MPRKEVKVSRNHYEPPVFVRNKPDRQHIPLFRALNQDTYLAPLAICPPIQQKRGKKQIGNDTVISIVNIVVVISVTIVVNVTSVIVVIIGRAQPPPAENKQPTTHFPICYLYQPPQEVDNLFLSEAIHFFKYRTASASSLLIYAYCFSKIVFCSKERAEK